MSYITQINRATDYIEAHLMEPLGIDAIAREAGLSRWHFQRIFRAMVGDTVSDYIRLRRLSHAAQALVETDARIIDIALAHEFASNEVFTRAFRRTFGTSPQAFRRDASAHQLIPHKPKVTKAYLTHLYGGMTMEPEIKEMPALHAVGLMAPFTPLPHENADNMEVIPALWQQFRARAQDFPGGADAQRIGVITLADGHDHSRLNYLAGVLAAPDAARPKDADSIHIPAASYAVFTHKGPVANIGHTMHYIFGSWLPQSGHEHADGPEFALYGPNFNPASKDAEVYIHIPLK